MFDKNHTSYKGHNNIVLVGPMGAGKSSIGKALARALAWDFYDSDKVVEERTGVDLLWIYDLEGEGGFQQREKSVIAELMHKRNIVLATGGNTVSLVENREAIQDGLIIYLRISLDDQLIRTGYNHRRPLPDIYEKRRQVLQQFRSECVPHYEQIAHIVYDTKKQMAYDVVNDLLTLIRK